MVGRIPATIPMVVAAIERVLAERGPLAEGELLAALAAEGNDLGRDPEGTLADLYDNNELALVFRLFDDRLMSLPALLTGRTFTHRVTSTELDHGFLAVSPDLAPVSMLTEDPQFRQLSDGSPVVEVLPGLDDATLRARGSSAEPT